MSASVPADGPEPSDGSRQISEDLPELHRHRRVELLVGARRRLAVGAPALEARGVAEPVALQVLVRDLGDQLDAQRLPRQVLARVPPALPRRACAARSPGLGVGLGPLAPRVVVERVVAVAARARRASSLARRGGEAARDADVVQHAVVVVEPEQQRADALAVLVHAEAGDDAVGGAQVLHLEHGALALGGTRRRAAWRSRRRGRRPRSARTTRAAASRSVVAGVR